MEPGLFTGRCRHWSYRLATSNCEEVLSHLWEYLDGELAADAVPPIRDHIAVCPACHRAWCVDGALLRRIAALEAARLAAPPPLRRRVLLLVRNA
jgi:anti-sigma factor (TIGR02949 family)